jgi:DNA-binding Lrp family transcriptional regulator
MEEERQDARTTPPGRRLTVSEAADALGISAEAVRGRIKRGTIAHERDGYRVFVNLDADQTATDHDQGGDQSTDQARPVELVEVLRDQLSYIREQLEQEREARRRADGIIAQLAQSNEEQARTIRAIEAPGSPQDAQHEGQETTAPGPERSTTPDSEATGEGNIERRGWWRRFFGGT